MVEISEYFAENPQIIMHGFIQDGITGTLVGQRDEQEERNSKYETDSDACLS